MNYAEQMCDWLLEEGYTHCFFVAGGNIMHLLNSARTRFECVPFVHEVAAGIAAEYFNEARSDGGGRAFALVTAGPGLTNIVTALAGSYLESRELLVIGGQVKSSDLSRGSVRQRGIQEIDGVALAAPVCKKTLRIEQPIGYREFIGVVRSTALGRPGPAFIEVCLDAQGGPALISVEPLEIDVEPEVICNAELLSKAAEVLANANRPVLLLGGGVSRSQAGSIVALAREWGIPCATTWNGADRIGADDDLYAGRPNTWGMRWANIVLQQADVIVAAGTRLGLQQTGFNWQEFAPIGQVVQIDIDPSELNKGHPLINLPLEGDVNILLPQLLREAGVKTAKEAVTARGDWQSLIREIRRRLPLADPLNETSSGYIDPFNFMQKLSKVIPQDGLIIPCSSGGAFTVTMQALLNKAGQVVITDKGLACMGYGLSGALGAALANRDKMVVLIEGDGGFAQNLQEIGTLARQNLNIKVFIFDNEGYASIRMTQLNYFGGAYVGCDAPSGLGMPLWPELFAAYGVPCISLPTTDPIDQSILELLSRPGPMAFIVPIDPAQTYFPKIASRVTNEGSMVSNPIHLMSPPLSDDLFAIVAPHLFLPGGEQK